MVVLRTCCVNRTFVFLFIDTFNFGNMACYKSIADEDAIKYKTTARYLVEELMELLADENYTFPSTKYFYPVATEKMLEWEIRMKLIL